MKPLASILTLITALILPSLPIVKRAIGIPGMIAYLAIGSLAIITLIRLYQSTALPEPIERILNHPRTPIFLSLALTLTLIGAYTLIFPRVNSQTAGEGSDRDDALNLAATRLLQGKYPYNETTYLDNPISPLPGSVLLATPFVLLGNSALQNLFWVAAFLYFIRHRLRDSPRLNSILLLTLFLSAQLFYEVVTGSDLLSNAIFVAIFGILWTEQSVRLHQSAGLTETAGSESAPQWQSLLLSIAFGITLASRVNFALVLLPLAAHLSTKTNWQTALRHTLIVGGTFLTLVLGFYLASPADFSPLHTASEIGILDVIIPRIGSVIIPLVMLAVTAYYSLPAVSKRWESVIAGLTIVQAIPVLVGVLLIIGFTQKLNVNFLFFGTTFMIFGILAGASQLNELKTIYD